MLNSKNSEESKMKAEEKANLIKITNGERLYSEFVDLIADANYANVMTPNTYTLKRMGKYKKINSKGFLRIAINELIINYEKRG